MAVLTKNLRNIAILGHSGCGKTTFSECMLFEAGAINRRGKVEENNTISDFNKLEHEKGSSIFTALMHVDWKESKINLLDTPGADDFVGEVISALKIADTGVMMLNAQNGVEVGTELIWEYVQDFRTPTLFVVNQLDKGKANFELTLEQAKERFGNKVAPVQYPYNQGENFDSIIDVLQMVMYVFPPDGGKPEKSPIPEAEMPKAQLLHNALVEAAAENEDGLMELFFEKGTLSEDELKEGLRIAIAHQEIFPVFCCSAVKNMGSGRVMGFINDVCPSPAERPAAPLENGGTLPCSTDLPTTIFIFKTATEPKVGKVTYFKVYSGVLNEGDELVNAQTGETERMANLFLTNGINRSAVTNLSAGDIGVTVKLKDTHTNNTLNTKGQSIRIEPIHFPEPKMRVALQTSSKSEMEKLMKALHQMEEEDLTLKVELSAALKQTLLHAQGQMHLDLVKHRLELLNHLDVQYIKPKISYRETITKSADMQYRHKKQSGGAGQFAEVHLRVEPYFEGMPEPEGLSVRNTELIDLPWGGHLAFYWCIVGGSIDANYANAIKKGIMQQMEEGPISGSPCQDIRVCIYDGKMHAVDSNDMAFMIAAKQAFRKAFLQATPQLLEPVYNLEVLCSNDVMGDIMGDLQPRRAMIMGVDAQGHYQKILAKIPLAEAYQYASTLRSISHGMAKFTKHFDNYSPVPGNIQEELMKEYQHVLVEE